MKYARMIDWYKLNNYFLYRGEDMMKYTIRQNKRSEKIIHSIPKRKHQKIRNKLLTCNHLREVYTTDTVFLKVTSFEGYHSAQVFVGIDSKFRSAFGMVFEIEGPKAMLELFKEDGFPISITSNNPKVQTSKTRN